MKLIWTINSESQQNLIYKKIILLRYLIYGDMRYTFSITIFFFNFSVMKSQEYMKSVKDTSKENMRNKR